MSQWLNEHLGWMAWTWSTALFFLTLAAALATLTVLASRRIEPERTGALGLATTRGDRFFLALLAAAFIHLIFLGLFGAQTLVAIGTGDGAIEISRLWIATAISLAIAALAFRYL